jgi:hypothetical protein
MSVLSLSLIDPLYQAFTSYEIDMSLPVELITETEGSLYIKSYIDKSFVSGNEYYISEHSEDFSKPHIVITFIPDLTIVRVKDLHLNDMLTWIKKSGDDQVSMRLTETFDNNIQRLLDNWVRDSKGFYRDNKGSYLTVIGHDTKVLVYEDKKDYSGHSRTISEDGLIFINLNDTLKGKRIIKMSMSLKHLMRHCLYESGMLYMKIPHNISPSDLQILQGAGWMVDWDDMSFNCDEYKSIDTKKWTFGQLACVSFIACVIHNIYAYMYW